MQLFVAVVWREAHLSCHQHMKVHFYTQKSGYTGIFRTVGAIYNTDSPVSQVSGRSNENCFTNDANLYETAVPTKKWSQIGTFSAFNIWRQITHCDSELRTCARTLREWINLANIVKLHFFTVKSIFILFSRFIRPQTQRRTPDE